MIVNLVVILVVLLLVAGGGGLISLIVILLSRWLGHNVPSSEAMAAFNTSEIARLESKRTKTKMEKDHRTVDNAEDEDVDDEIDGTTDRVFEFLGKYSRYVALLAAWIATCGSLFFSEALGWVPCLLCWYQRILMYPLSLILAVGLLRRDKGLHKYVLVLSIPGACVSLYHYLYQKTDLLRGTVPCQVGVPCSVDYLNWFGGVVTIPFLALIAFLIITLCMIAYAMTTRDEEPETATAPKAADSAAGRLANALPVLVIVAVVVLAFVIAGATIRRATASAVPAGSPTTAQPFLTPNPTALARGKVLYEETCAQCHGVNGQGTSAGLPLAASQLVLNGSNDDLAKFVRMGRTAQDPHNVTQMAMPASGGRTDIGDQDLAAIVAYMRHLAQNAGKSAG